ncbi:MAG: tetratricopeptide repeat protein [Flavobacteriales bacterium]|nr:tetratricopeptide repeat protein [Flavobacteriales bacterium]
MRTLFLRPLRPLLAVVALLLFALPGFSQRTAHYEHADADLINAMELFDMAKYGAAQFEFQRVAERVPDLHDPTRTEAEFYMALCSVRLFNDDAGYRLLTFMSEHPEDLHVPAVRFELFRYAFAQKDYDKALAWSEQVDRLALSAEETEEYRFKRGYAYFQEGDKEKALGEFSATQNSTGIYGAPSLYYASHIQYERGNHETALIGFRKLEADENFAKVVPIYIAEILFLQGKYDELNAYVKPLLEDPQGAKRINEINRLAGEANYRNGNYTEALPYLQKSAQRVGVDRSDRYILGYAYYKTGDCTKALAEFNVVANGEDSLAQLATYHMADCYIRVNEKNFARNAFKRAYEIGKDPKITEDALFQYAKLAYELSFDPYHEAINALRNYLKTYPNTPRRDEAYEFLLNVYLRTKNYEDALTSLDEIQNKDLRLKEAYQKLAYNRGVELYDGRKYADAALFFERALKYPVNQRLNAQSNYWMAESYYGQGDMPAALRKYDDLRNTPGAYSTELYEQAGYGMGYVFFKLKQYDEASIAFRRYLTSRSGEARQRADAMLRTGDCFFVMKDNEQAVKWYDDAMRTGSSDRDYAMYQKGVCQGLLRKHNEKQTTLKALLTETPDSRYAADAKFQLGETNIILENDGEALRYYTMVTQQHPNSPLVRQAMLQTALIHKRMGNVDQAIADFKAVVSKYRTAEGSRDALAGLKNIYIELGRVADYETYIRTLEFIDPATEDLDQDYYQSAEKLYFEEKCPQAIGAFGDYINKYPRGGYVLNAYYYRGDCQYRAGQCDQALPDLEEVIRREGTQFMESALVGASDILFRQKRWEGALDYFNKLEPVASFPQNTLAAQVGRMRCLRELGRTSEAAVAAEKVVANSNATSDLKAEGNILMAKALADTNDYDAAYIKFKAVSTASTNAMGAEAKYNMAYIRHLQAQYKKAETEVFELVQRYPSYDHWKAMGFILLGDVYVQLNDRFQARATLQSVIDHCQEPDLVAQARQRLEAINASDVQQNAPRQQEDITIPMPGNRNGQ